MVKLKDRRLLPVRCGWTKIFCKPNNQPSYSNTVYSIRGLKSQDIFEQHFLSNVNRPTYIVFFIRIPRIGHYYIRKAMIISNETVKACQKKMLHNEIRLIIGLYTAVYSLLRRITVTQWLYRALANRIRNIQFPVCQHIPLAVLYTFTIVYSEWIAMYCHTLYISYNYT